MLRLAGAADGGDLAAFLVRAVALDPAVLVRLRASAPLPVHDGGAPRQAAGGSPGGGPGGAAGGGGSHGGGSHGGGSHGGGSHGGGSHGGGSHGGGSHGGGWGDDGAGGGRVTAYARLPFGVPVSRTVGGSVEPGDVTVAAADLLPLLDGDAEVVLPRRRDAEWRSGLPPAAGWVRLDEVPAEVVRSLVRAGAAALRAVPAGAAASAGESLLDHESLSVSGAGRKATVPLRVLTALARMGFLGDPAGPAAAGGVVVSVAPGGWVRLAAAYGSAYQRASSVLGLRPR